MVFWPIFSVTVRAEGSQRRNSHSESDIQNFVEKNKKKQQFSSVVHEKILDHLIDLSSWSQ